MRHAPTMWRELTMLFRTEQQRSLNVAPSAFDMLTQDPRGVARTALDRRMRERGVLGRYVAVRRMLLEKDAAIAIALVVQGGAELAEQRHLAGGNQLGMEGAMGSLPGVLLRRGSRAALAAAQLMQRRQDAAFPGDVTVLDSLLDRQAFELDAKPDDFGEIARRDRSDPVATLVDQGDQAVIFQTTECFAERTEADAEGGTQPVQIELASRQQLAAHDLEGAVNPALEAEGLPGLSIRVGADHGVAVVSQLSVPSTGFSEPVLKSDGLNRCAKIQAKAKAGQFLIGRDLYERVHVQWLERCTEVNVDLAGAFGLENYEIYSVN